VSIFDLEKDKQDRNIFTVILVIISIPIIALDIDYLFNNSQFFNFNEKYITGFISKWFFIVIPIVTIYRVTAYFIDKENFKPKSTNKKKSEPVDTAVIIVAICIVAFGAYNLGLGDLLVNGKSTQKTEKTNLSKNLSNKLIPLSDKSKKIIDPSDKPEISKPTGCLEGDCNNSFSKKEYSNGYYIGEFENKEENGQGTFVWTGGDKYIGEWKDGNRTGQGKYIWSDGDEYNGDFFDNNKHGQGTIVWSNGNRYIGEWKNNTRTGLGTFIWANGAKYTGDFLDGERTGKGTMLYSDGGRYTGDFLNGDRHGKGTLVWPSGDKYDGEFKKNESDGEGTYVWANGNKYLGEFFQGKRIGQGTYISNEDNSMLVGKFDGDLIDGFVILPDGFKLRAFRKNGELVFNRVEGTNQNIDLLAQQLKRNNDLQTSRMLLDISKSLMGTNKNSSSLKLSNPILDGGWNTGSSTSGMYKTCYYKSSLGTKTKTVFASAPCPMAY